MYAFFLQTTPQASQLPTSRNSEANYTALFSSKIFCKTGTVALSFVCEKYYPIID